MKKIIGIMLSLSLLLAVSSIFGSALSEEVVVNSGAELQTAVEAGKNVKLGQNILVGVVVLDKNTSVIDLNGKNFTVTDTISIGVNSTLTVKSSISGGEIIYNSGSPKLILINCLGTFVAENIKVTSYMTDENIFFRDISDNGSKVSMKNVELSGFENVFYKNLSAAEIPITEITLENCNFSNFGELSTVTGDATKASKITINGGNYASNWGHFSGPMDERHINYTISEGTFKATGLMPDIPPFTFGTYNSKEFIEKILAVGSFFDKDIIETTIEGKKLYNLPAEVKVIKYAITNGDNQTYTTSSGKDTTIICNGIKSRLKNILVDDKMVDAANYTLADGSTVLTLKASYLNTLAAGAHKVTFEYNDGNKIDAVLNVSVKNPATGDETIMYLIPMTTSLLGAALFLRKRNKKAVY